MNLLEILIVSLIAIACFAYIVIYIRQPFRNKNNSCAGCPYGDICGNKDGNQ